jgi:hypothetical protein
MRFLSSSALPMAPKLRLAASCSAADAIGLQRNGPGQGSCPQPGRATTMWRHLRSGRGVRNRPAAATASATTASSSWTVPPACSTAATADRDADTVSVMRTAARPARDAHPSRAWHTVPPRRGRRWSGCRVELARIDRLLDAAEVHLVVILAE